MRDYKRKKGLKFFDFDFEYFDEYGLQEFIDFLRNQKNYMNSSVIKCLSLLKVVLRWAYRMEYHKNNKFEAFKPKMKTTQKKVIFLTKVNLTRSKMQKSQKQNYIFTVSVMYFCSSAILVFVIQTLRT